MRDGCGTGNPNECMSVHYTAKPESYYPVTTPAEH